MFRTRAPPPPLVTQNARPDERPYLHPIVAPDGRGVLTEDKPAHHPHQTGLYWGFTRLNGRDYFHNPGAKYWRRVSATVLRRAGDEVRWQTVYDLLDEAGQPVLTETQRWAMRERNGALQLDLTWRGEAKTDVTIGQVRLRRPVPAHAVARGHHRRSDQRGAPAERPRRGQRAMWVDGAMQVEGRDDLAHIAIFDHPDNTGYPQPGVSTISSASVRRARAPPTGRSRAIRPRSSAIACSSTPAVL